MRALAAAVLTAALAGPLPACPIVTTHPPTGEHDPPGRPLSVAGWQAERVEASADAPPAPDLLTLLDPPPPAPVWAHGGRVFTTPADPPSRIARGTDHADPTGEPEPRNRLPDPVWLVVFGSVVVGGIVAVLRRTAKS